jgi:hypothetical protein
VDLPHDPIKVFGPSKRVHRQCEINLIGAHKRKIGKVTLVKLHLDLVNFGELASGVESGEVVIDGDDMGAGQRQAHRIVPEANTELENLLALGGGDETQRVVTGQVWSPRDGVERKFGSAGKRTRGTLVRAGGSVIVHVGSLPRSTAPTVDRPIDDGQR